MDKKIKLNIWYIVAAMFGVLLLQSLWVQSQQVETIPYSEFQAHLKEGRVAEVVVTETYIRGVLTDGEHRQFITMRVEPGIAEELAAQGVKFTGATEQTFLRDLLSWVLPVLLFFGLWMFVFRKIAEKQGLGGGFMTVGKSKAKVYVETNVPFFSISGSEFVEMFVGVGAARVRDLFEQARQKAPAIIFIDELDALGRARGSFGLGGHDEKEQTLAQLLAELDGFDPSVGVVLLAATNRPEILDPALLRAGRFARQVLVDRPDKRGRIQILQVHIKKIRLAPEVDLEQIAALTPGFSGADLANLVNEAALLATRRAGESVTLDDFTHAVERIVAGLEKKNRLLNEKERRVVAYHEMGHALVAMSLPGTDPVHKISIIPRGVGELGYTIQRPTEDRFLMTREELEDKMAVLLGGRAAEEVVFGHLSTGAADDLVKVTGIARSMAMRYGMVGTLGHVAYEEERTPFLEVPGVGRREHSEATAREIDVAVREIVSAAYDKALGLLRRQREVLERGAQQLLVKETLVEAEIKQLGVEVARAGFSADRTESARGKTAG